MKKVKFIKLRGYGYDVEVNGERVGTLMVERMGWKQFDAKRGTPSQTWKFVSALDSTTNTQADYFKDIKAKVTETLSGQPSVRERLCTPCHVDIAGAMLGKSL